MPDTTESLPGTGPALSPVHGVVLKFLLLLKLVWVGFLLLSTKSDTSM